MVNKVKSQYTKGCMTRRINILNMVGFLILTSDMYEFKRQIMEQGWRNNSSPIDMMDWKRRMRKPLLAL